MSRDADGLVVVNVFPQLLGTYGDGGNARVLARRMTDRGEAATVIDATFGEPLPTYGDIYVLGGGEDTNLYAAARQLADERALHSAIDRGAAVLAVCAGFQLLGSPGLGILASSTTPMPRRAVGHLVVRASESLALSDPLLVGFENHSGCTTIAEGSTPLGSVEHGVGNGGSHAVDGQVCGRIIATYLHGPVLALNPTLADHLLASVVGELSALPPAYDDAADRARSLRLEIVRREGGRRTPWAAARQ